jgi:hypothetical protein
MSRFEYNTYLGSNDSIRRDRNAHSSTTRRADNNPLQAVIDRSVNGVNGALNSRINNVSLRIRGSVNVRRGSVNQNVST